MTNLFIKRIYSLEAMLSEIDNQQLKTDNSCFYSQRNLDSHMQNDADNLQAHLYLPPSNKLIVTSLFLL